MSDEALPAPPAAEHRGWSLKMIRWSAALAAFLLAAAWGTANWKAFHLAYCRHLLKSQDPDTRDKGIAMVLRTHVRPGMTFQQVARLLHPVELAKVAGTIYSCSFVRRQGGDNVAILRFGDDGLLVECGFWVIAK